MEREAAREDVDEGVTASASGEPLDEGVTGLPARLAEGDREMVAEGTREELALRDCAREGDVLVVAVPLDVTIRRTFWFALSDTYTAPAASTATKLGCVKVAERQGPFTEPVAPVPARVVTTAAKVTLRMVPPLISATKRAPAGVAVTAFKPLKEALAPVPSVSTALPEPAKVEIA